MKKKNEKSEEHTRKQQWLDRLKTIDSYWRDGDALSHQDPTPDFINQNKKIAIELKREKGGPTTNIESHSNRLQKYFESADSKFAYYPNYETMLLVEISSYSETTRAALEKIPKLFFDSGSLVGAGFRNERLFENMEHIGCIVFWPKPNSFLNSILNTAYYFDNPFAEESCKMNQARASYHLSAELKFLEVNSL